MSVWTLITREVPLVPSLVHSLAFKLTGTKNPRHATLNLLRNLNLTELGRQPLLPSGCASCIWGSAFNFSLIPVGSYRQCPPPLAPVLLTNPGSFQSFCEYATPTVNICENPTPLKATVHSKSSFISSHFLLTSQHENEFHQNMRYGSYSRPQVSTGPLGSFLEE